MRKYRTPTLSMNYSLCTLNCLLLWFLWSGTNDVFADTACDRHYLMLNCSTSAYTINILYAYYGSYPLSCGQGITNVSCQGSDTKNVIISKCQDLKTCQVFVSGSMFAHNCPDGPVHRQLEVFYQCTSRNIRSMLDFHEN